MGIAGGPEGSLLGGGEKLFGVFANAGGGGGAAGTALFFFPLKVENSAFLADDVSTLPIFCSYPDNGVIEARVISTARTLDIPVVLSSRDYSYLYLRLWTLVVRWRVQHCCWRREMQLQPHALRLTVTRILVHVRYLITRT